MRPVNDTFYTIDASAHPEIGFGPSDLRPRTASMFAADNYPVMWDESGPYIWLPDPVEYGQGTKRRLKVISDPIYDIGYVRFPEDRFQRAIDLYSIPAAAGNMRAQMMRVYNEQLASIPGVIPPDDLAADVAAEHMRAYGQHYTIASNIEGVRYTILDRLLNQPAVVATRGGRVEILNQPDVIANIQAGSGQATAREQAAADSYDFLAEFGPWFMAIAPIGAALFTAIGAGIGAGATAAGEAASVGSAGAAELSAGTVIADGVQTFAVPGTEAIEVFALPADVSMATPLADLEFLGTVGGSPSAVYDLASAVHDFSNAIPSPSGVADVSSAITTDTLQYTAPQSVGSASSATGGAASGTSFSSIVGGASATVGVASAVRNLLNPTGNRPSPSIAPSQSRSGTIGTVAPSSPGFVDSITSSPLLLAGIAGVLLLALANR